MSEEPNWWPLKWRPFSVGKNGWNAATVRLPNGRVLMVHDFTRRSFGMNAGKYYIEDNAGEHVEFIRADLFELKCFLSAQALVDTQTK